MSQTLLQHSEGSEQVVPAVAPPWLTQAGVVEVETVAWEVVWAVVAVVAGLLPVVVGLFGARVALSAAVVTSGGAVVSPPSPPV